MLKLFNTLTKQKEEFIPREGKRVGMFVCGPTVYDQSHIGHAKTYIFFDVVAKYLRRCGYKVNYIQNITDIDDKIIQRAKEQNRSSKDLAQEFEKKYFEDVKALKIDSVTKYARATSYVKQIVKQIETLIKRGHAYKIAGEGYYFDLATFPEYGKLANRTTLQAEDSVSRIDEGINKRNRGDFALWKFSKEGEPTWDTALGSGRPGWHIEDTAITEYHLGPQYDLHGGAEDLKFPHHEAEIAQQESASGLVPFVKYWLHTGFVTVNGRKMSKSVGNFVTVKEILKNYSPEALRMMSLSGHYRSPLDYNDKLIKQFQAGVNRISELISKLKHADGSDDPFLALAVTEADAKFSNAMNDDFNTPEAIATLFDLVRKINPLFTTSSISKNDAKRIANFIKKVDQVLGIIPKEQKIPKEILELVDTRERYREAEDWQKADNVRGEIEKLGYQIEDTIYGPLLSCKVIELPRSPI